MIRRNVSENEMLPPSACSSRYMWFTEAITERDRWGLLLFFGVGPIDLNVGQ